MSDTKGLPLSEYPLEQLYREAEGVKHVMDDFKTRANLIQAEIEARTADAVKLAISQAGKSHGTIRAQITNTLSAKIDISKKVEWDSAKLQAIAQTLPWERVAKIFKIDFSISEKIYDGIGAALPELADKIDMARTVKYSAPKVVLVMETEAV